MNLDHSSWNHGLFCCNCLQLNTCENGNEPSSCIKKKNPLELQSHLAHKKVAKWFKVLNKLQIAREECKSIMT